MRHSSHSDRPARPSLPLPARGDLSRVKGIVPALLLLLGLSILPMSQASEPVVAGKKTTSLATFGGGCFWCLEAVFETLKGVKAVTSGYAGGRTENPNYQQVCGGRTGHAEVIQVEFDPGQITYEQLLSFFWKAHDPTTRNRQGPDVGTQYRSIVLYHDEAQKKAAEQSLLLAIPQFRQPIVTEIVPLQRFYPAEDYHQDYFRKNPNAPYCVAMIRPKLQKLGKP